MKRTTPRHRRSALLPRSWRSALLAAALVLIPLSGARGQDRPLLGLEVRETDGRVDIQIGDIFEGGGIRESLESGLPVRVELITELWRDRFFDSQEGRSEWRATIWYDPLAGTYRIETANPPVALSTSPEAALEILRSRVRADLDPSSPGRYYYLGRIQIETLSLSDLEELRHWLQGELAPAIDGDEEVGGALGRGIRRLFVRALGLPALRAQARSDPFDWEG